MSQPPERSIDDVLAATPLLSVAGSRTVADLARASRWRTIERNGMLFVAGERRARGAGKLAALG
jgi:hypothetical protein